jgi:hypothetical protein
MNKAQIRTQVLALLNRNDCTDATADTFIDLALSRIQRTLRIAPMERQQNYTSNDVGDNLLSLPADFLSMKYLWTGQTMLEYRDYGTFLSLPEAQGAPKVYTRVRGGLLVKPIPPIDTPISLIYYGEFDDLPTDTSDNALTNFAPDLLVYGALSFAADYFVDDRRELFEGRYSTIYNEVEEQSRTVEWDQATLSIQSVYPNVNY